MPVRWWQEDGAVFCREIPGIRSDGTPERRPPPPRRQAQGRASGSGLSQEERVSAPKGAPYFVGYEEEEDSLRLDERKAADAETRRRMQMHIHGKITIQCTTFIGRADVEDDVAAHELAAAKRRRQDSEL